MTGSAGVPPASPTPPAKARGIRRWVYLSLGLVCLVLAAVGAVVPVLPCTPWVLAASYFFARSSDWFSRLLRRSPCRPHFFAFASSSSTFFQFTTFHHAST